MTRIAIVGAGHIGGNLARLFAGAGHETVVSFARDEARLRELARSIGATAAGPSDAVAETDVVVVSVPWAAGRPRRPTRPRRPAHSGSRRSTR